MQGQHDHTFAVLVGPTEFTGDRMFPSARSAAVLISIASKDIQAGIATEILAMTQVLAGVDPPGGGWETEEVTFSVNITAEAKVQLIGGVGMGGGTGITIKLKRKK